MSSSQTCIFLAPKPWLNLFLSALKSSEKFRCNTRKWSIRNPRLNYFACRSKAFCLSSGWSLSCHGLLVSSFITLVGVHGTVDLVQPGPKRGSNQMNLDIHTQTCLWATCQALPSEKQKNKQTKIAQWWPLEWVAPLPVWDHPSWIRKAGCFLGPRGAVCHFRVWSQHLKYILDLGNTLMPVSSFLSVPTPGIHTFYPYRFNSTSALVSVLIVVMPHLNKIIRVKLPYVY